MRIIVTSSLLAVAWLVLPTVYLAAENKTFRPGAIWPDSEGKHINAHSAGILYQKETYYWFGEKRGREQESLGINV